MPRSITPATPVASTTMSQNPSAGSSSGSRTAAATAVRASSRRPGCGSTMVTSAPRPRAPRRTTRRWYPHRRPAPVARSPLRVCPRHSARTLSARPERLCASSSQPAAERTRTPGQRCHRRSRRDSELHSRPCPGRRSRDRIGRIGSARTTGSGRLRPVNPRPGRRRLRSRLRRRCRRIRARVSPETGRSDCRRPGCAGRCRRSPSRPPATGPRPPRPSLLAAVDQSPLSGAGDDQLCHARSAAASI